MRPRYLILLSIFCVIAALTGPASAGPADITVTSSTLDPQVLMKGDTGTLTIVIQNTGAETVAIKSARLYGSGVVPLSEPYPSVGELGAGNTKTFTFTVRADGGEGTFYPQFVLDFRNDGSLRHPVPVQVEDTPLSASVINKPDAFAEGRTADITVRVGNPRPNAASGVQVIPIGTGFTATPTGGFVGALAPDAAGTVTFNLTPTAETDVTFQVVWRNGINTHTADLVLPVTFGEDKRQADPVITNVEVTPEAGRYRVVGDISNAGLESARSVVIAPGAPAAPTDPFRIYVVGTLDPDDISSFEVTFKAERNVTEVPIVVEYRDGDGNRYTATTMVGLGGATLPAEGSGGDLPVVAIIVVVLVALGIAGAIYYSWRRT
ncbi:CARDB domain-containing protein [Methanoculleus sp.]|uniref:COG1361 S-layer family protein n=1 Tax=Methanoculleus sp. TaxID=90427 RepID=UPI0025E4FBAE|nr:CARDB domain-containing protein [Methanoculleus sp.]